MPLTRLLAFRSPRQPVFSVGRNLHLLSARQSALHSNGMLVSSVSPEQASAFVRETAPRVWVFCCTVEMPTLAYLACSVRRYSPLSRLLLIEGETPAGIETCLFHRVIGGQSSTDVLVATVRDLALAA